MTTTNKSYNTPTVGGDTGTWGGKLNTIFDQIDLNLGGYYSIVYSSTTIAVTYNSTNTTAPSTGVLITLPSSIASNGIYKVSGAISANQNMVLPAGGGIYVINNATTGSFSYTVITSAGGSVGYAVPQGGASIVYSDATNVYNLTNYVTSPVQYTQIQSISSGSLIGNSSSSTTTPSSMSITQALDLISGVSSGSIIYRTSAEWVNLGRGTDGQFVKQASGAPSWADASPRVLLNTLTATNSNFLNDITSLTSTYAFYDLEFSNLIPGTNAISMEFQIYSGGSYQTAGYLVYSRGGYNNGDTLSSAPTTYMSLCGAADVGNIAPGLCGVMTFFNPSAASICLVQGNFTYSCTASRNATFQVGGYWNTAAVVTGFKLLPSSGVIASGTIKVYGYN